MLEDDIYIPVQNEELSEKSEKEADERDTFEGLGEKYEKKFYKEVTYGETREKEGRLNEKLQNGDGEDGWDGRVQGRHWRGRRGRSPGISDVTVSYPTWV